MKKLENAFREEMERVFRDGFPATEVAESKKAWLQERTVNRSSDRYLAQKLSGNDFHGRTMAWDGGLEKKIDALTPAQIQDVVRRRLDLKSITIVKAGDFKKAGITN